MTDDRIDELEGLRGVAAFMVFLYHVPLWHPALHSIALVRNSYVLVDLFFVLSGFVICRAYGDRLVDVRSALRFQWLRFGRLYPVHLLFLIVWLGLEALKYLALRHAGVESPNSTPFGVNDAQAFAEQLFLVQALGFTQSASTFNFPAWSISTEFWTYVVFALVALATLRTPRLRFAAFCAIVAAAVLLLALAPQGIGTFDKILRCLAGFFTGALTAVVLGSAPGRVGRRSSAGALPAAVPFAVLLGLLCLSPGHDPWGMHSNWDLLVLPLSVALLVSIVLGPQDPLRRLLRSGPLVRLGALSYALYLGHTLIIWTVNQVCRVVLRTPQVEMSNGQFSPSLSLPGAVLAYIVATVSLLVLSAAVHRWVEVPWRLRARRARLFAAATTVPTSREPPSRALSGAARSGFEVGPVSPSAGRALRGDPP